MADIAWTYDAFGNTVHGLGSSPNSYQFNGQSNDGTGLYFLRARYYPTTTPATGASSAKTH